jgi:hypothetical protein
LGPGLTALTRIPAGAARGPDYGSQGRLARRVRADYRDTQLADEIHDAASHLTDDYERALHAAGSAYVGFAVRESALLDLMFAAKVDDPSEAVRSAAERLFNTMTDIMSAGVDAGAYDARDVGRLTLLLSATVQGISALVASRRITTPQSEALIDDAITVFLAGASTKR